METNDKLNNELEVEVFLSSFQEGDRFRIDVSSEPNESFEHFNMHNIEVEVQKQKTVTVRRGEKKGKTIVNHLLIVESEILFPLIKDYFLRTRGQGTHRIFYIKKDDKEFTIPFILTIMRKQNPETSKVSEQMFLKPYTEEAEWIEEL